MLPPCRRAKEVCDRATSPALNVSPSHSTAGGLHLPAASSNPFLVNVLPSHMRKPPTLEECEVVIRQLWNINHMQMQEVGEGGGLLPRSRGTHAGPCAGETTVPSLPCS